jgi:16S rRNA (uracil1498-N3)-methyltransferase
MEDHRRGPGGRLVVGDDRAPVATFFTDAPLARSASVRLDESAAHHARVKRLAVGDAVRLSDGRGTIALGEIGTLDKRACEVRVDATHLVAAPPPIHLRVPIGDRDRMLMLAEKAAELGATSWQAVRFRRSMSVSPRGEGPAFAAKLRTRMIAALEQSGGAWLPQQLADVSPDEIDLPADATRLLLDVGGAPLLDVFSAGPAVILFGPEGGFEDDERAAFDATGWRRASLAATTLRFETAGIAATAVIRAAQLRKES